MTPDQAQQLTTKIYDINQQLFYISQKPRHFTTDDYHNHTELANMRGELQQIDQQIFECYRLMNKFYDTNHPIAAARRTPTIDDLEI